MFCGSISAGEFVFVKYIAFKIASMAIAVGLEVLFSYF